MCPYKNLHTDVHILHYTLFIITKKWKQTKGLSTNEIRKMWYIHTVGYRSTTKSNEVLIDAPYIMDEP